MRHRYLLALGSNICHPMHGLPPRVLAAALAALESSDLRLLCASRVIRSDPVGPSLRQYANAAALVETNLDPEGLLAWLKELERKFGRRPGGGRWRARVLDLDIILWSGGCHAARHLLIPHSLFREREFVLRPAAEIAGDWRDPVTHLSVRQLYARLTRGDRLPRAPA